MVMNVMMMKWSRPVPGREKDSVELYGMLTSYCAKKVKDGTIDSFEPVILSANGSHLGGFFMLRADAAKLDKLRHDDKLLELIVRANVLLDRFAVVRGYGGDEVNKLMKVYQKII